jgi:ribosomal protein S18 acetylase RimI-like enzyme
MHEEVWVTTDKSGAMVLLKAPRTEDVDNRKPVVLYQPTVHYIVVAAKLRHRGIGRKLVEHAQSLYDDVVSLPLEAHR